MALLGLTACKPAVNLTASPTPQILQVDYTPALRPFTTQLNQCAASQPDLGLADREVPAKTLDLSQSDMGLQWGEISAHSGFTVEIGQETLIIITNPENPLRELSLSDLQSLYSGNIQNWNTLEPDQGFDEAVQIWLTPLGADDRQVFNNLMSADKTLSPQAYLAPDPQAMLEAVATNRGAIGYLPSQWHQDSVQKIQLNDAPLSILEQPILASTSIEPTGKVRIFLQCLQKMDQIQ